ncbi:S-layer homology domain-containing protein [Paenibacillus sp. MBLB4367]|uniref:S-layer homology domain-containing protein n=1 Tax=Paenibacillus sp. MBLB4367 TaxID=3384767 RepID=UPI0039080767
MKKAIIALLTAVTLVAATPVMAASKFSDVKETNWAAPSIDFMVNKKVLSGYEDGTFKPENPVTKAELAHMYRALFPTAGSRATEELPFVDIKGHWASEDFSVLFSEDYWSFADYFDENEQPYLAPEKELTRWDVMMMIGLLTKELDLTSDNNGIVVVGADEVLTTIAQYKDIKISPMVSFEDSSFYSPEILTYTFEGDETTYAGDVENIKAILLYSIIKSGIMVGADGNFRPKDKVTRAEAVTILHRVYTKLGNK